MNNENKIPLLTSSKPPLAGVQRSVSRPIVSESNSLNSSLQVSSSTVYEEPSSITEVFSCISKYITNKFSTLTSIPYTFTDIKLLSNESCAFGVTSEGFCISINMSLNLFNEVLLSKNGLSGILIFDSEKKALIKEKASGKIFIVELSQLNIVRLLHVKGEGITGIGKMGFSPDENYLYARLWKGEIVRWDMRKFDQDLGIKVKKSICFNIAPDGLPVVGTLDGKIIVFSKDLEKVIEKNFDFEVDAFISFSQTGHLIILAMQKEIKIVSKVTLNLVKVIPISTQAYDCLMTSDNNYIVASLETGEIAFINTSHSSKTLKLQVHNSAVKSLFLINSESEILSFGDDLKIGKTKFPQISLYKKINDVKKNKTFNLTSQSHELAKQILNSQLSDPEYNFKVSCVSQSPSSDVIIICGHSKKILVFESKSSKKLGKLSGHEDFVYSLECLTDEILASGSADCSIKIWNFRSMNLLFTLSNHSDIVTCLLKLDNSRLASGSKDKSVKIWLWEERTIMYQILDLNSGVISFLAPKPDILLIGLKENIQCWELNSYTMLFDKVSKDKIPDLRLVDLGIEGDKRPYITLGMEEESHCFTDPFQSPQIRAVGHDEYSEFQFLAYIQTITMYRIPDYECKNDKWIVFPYMVNTLHYYAYFDMPEYLFEAIMNGAGLIANSLGDTPLTLAISKRHKDCIQSIINAAWEKRLENPYLLTGLKIDSILALNSLNVPCLAKLYSLLLVNYESFSKYCPEETQLPIMKSSLLPIIFTGNICSWDVNDGIDVEVSFKRSISAFYLENGSKNSIDMMESFCFADQVKIFKTDTIKTIVKFKWQKAKRILIVELFVFFCFYTCFLAISIFGNFSGLLIAGNILSVLLITENLLIYTQSNRVDLWCILDFIRFALFLIYYSFIFFDVTFTPLPVILIVVISAQGIYYFKLWKGTRRLITLLIKVGYDIFSFVIVLLYLLIPMGAILHIIALKENLHPLETQSLITISEDNFSDFIENLFLVFMTFINPIIMLNILLALSSDNSQKNLEATKISELIDIGKCILRTEYILIFKRSSGKPEYLQICVENKKKKTEKLKKLARIVKSVTKLQKNNQAQVMNKLSSFDKKIKEIEVFMQDLKELKQKPKRA